MILILMVFTYSCSDSKNKLIMLENNTNNLNENSIKLNINLSFTMWWPKFIITDMSVLTKKSFSRKAHENIRLMNHWNHCLLHNESLLMAWTFNTHDVYKNLFVHPSVNGIPFSCNHLRNSSQSFIWCPACLQNLQVIRRICFLGALSLNSEEELYYLHAQIYHKSNKHM
jgi:hypothetical protein